MFSAGHVDPSPYVITIAEQREDGEWSSILDSLASSASRAMNSRDALLAKWHVKDGLLYKRSITAEAEPMLRLVVPTKARRRLMMQFHYINHRGMRPLVDQLSKSYYWPGMAEDCNDFTRACTICQARLSKPLGSAVSHPIPTSSTPFSVLHIDHKGPLPRAGKFVHILVVGCALTRFTLFIPVQDVGAETTLKTLVARVFCIFGYPLIVVSDNGPAFRSLLAVAFAKFFGYRHIFILPYNAQANGAAESNVKRIKLLLDRHTDGYADWPHQLPLAQLLLNTTTHTGTGMTPHFALFGREATALEQLENPALIPIPLSGNDFLIELRDRLIKLHHELRLHSDAIKLARTTEETNRKYSRLATSRFGKIVPGAYVWLIRGSKAQADYTRKHGHGQVWKYRYKVLEVTPYAVLLEIPKDKSAPHVSPWQMIRRVTLASDQEHDKDASTPVVTEYGIPLPSSHPTVVQPALTPIDGDLGHVDEEFYDIEEIHHAEKVGQQFKIWISWKGYEEISWRWKHQLVKEISDPTLLRQIEEAVEAARKRVRIEVPATATDDDRGGEESEIELPLDELLPHDSQLRRSSRVVPSSDKYIPIMQCSTMALISRADKKQLLLARELLINRIRSHFFLADFDSLD